jgi:DNA-binding transcriptional MerR regulator
VLTVDRRGGKGRAIVTEERHTDRLMTIGELSRRTGVSVKVLRRYDGHGLLYSAGRSRANYRLFDESALWCVRIITGLRNLGLTVAEICKLAAVYFDAPEAPIGPYLAEQLHATRARLDARISELEGVRQRIDEFEERHRAELFAHPQRDLRGMDPTMGVWIDVTLR